MATQHLNSFSVFELFLTSWVSVGARENPFPTKKWEKLRYCFPSASVTKRMNYMIPTWLFWQFAWNSGFEVGMQKFMRIHTGGSGSNKDTVHFQGRSNRGACSGVLWLITQWPSQFVTPVSGLLLSDFIVPPNKEAKFTSLLLKPRLLLWFALVCEIIVLLVVRQGWWVPLRLLLKPWEQDWSGCKRIRDT